jgi:hypothetical protein
MSLQVIGSGLPRTATLSLKLALEKLGFGPCHHMADVQQRPGTMRLWVAAGGGKPEWDSIFAGFHSAVDAPACMFWRELMEYYPEAKIVHSVREPEEWFESTQATIFTISHPEPKREFFAMINSRFGDRLHDRDLMIEYFTGIRRMKR